MAQYSKPPKQIFKGRNSGKALVEGYWRIYLQGLYELGLISKKQVAGYRKIP